MRPIIELKAAGRTFVRGPIRTEALKPTDLQIGTGEFLAVTGRSGSGKSTFLNLVSGIDRPTSGAVTVDGVNLQDLNESRLSRFRGEKIGIVFQFFELIQTLTAVENVQLAMDLVGAIPVGQRRRRAMDLLDQVGIAGHARKLPSRLSGGEQQRVAIARALANDPPIIVADEPAGNLDSVNSEVVASIFADFARQGRTVIVATHEQAGLERYSRVLHVADGAFATEAAK